MNITRFAKDHDIRLRCNYSSHTSKWHATARNAEVCTDDGFLRSVVGKDPFNPNAAITRLCDRLQGEKLKIDNERYVSSPSDLYHEPS